MPIRIDSNRDDHDSVVEAEKRLARAHLSLDLDIISILLHSDYVIMQPDGTMETRADVLASYQSGDRHWDSAQVDELQVRIYGETAVTTGRWRASGQNAGRPFDYAARFLSVWVKEDGRWQNVTYQSVEIDEGTS